NAKVLCSHSAAANKTIFPETPCSIRMAAGGGFPFGKPAGRSQREVFGAFFYKGTSFRDGTARPRAPRHALPFS
ncbi:MAG: hypothetical protein PUE41_05730, partial [bacterium]|nr:hypothetical protein [bacterium]